MITLPQAVRFVWSSFKDMSGGEIFVKKIPSMKVIDIAKAVDPKAELDFIGIRPGEKLHEQMIGSEDSFNAFEFEDHFRIFPQIQTDGDLLETANAGTKVAEGFTYSSDDNSSWMSAHELSLWIENNRESLCV